MARIKLDTVPHLCTYFDPIKWPEQNPMVHPEVYKLNEAQLKLWGEVATKIRKNIIKKSELYNLYSKKIPEVQIEVVEQSRKSIPHSTKKSNPEGLLESQIKSREKLNAGNTKSFKKRHLKELPISTQEAIVKMYLEDHVFQSDIAKYYKISTALVGKLVKEAKQNP